VTVRRPVVVGLGLCVIDHLYVVEDLAGARERARYKERKVEVGGMTSNALAQAARLGCRAELISLVGDDADGRLARRRLRAAGVGTRRLVLSDAFPTTAALVMIGERDGERRFVTAHRAPFERRVPDFDLTPVRAGSVLMIDGHFPSQARRAARRACALGVPVVADFSDPRRDYVSLLRWVDHPVLPETFVRTWSPGDPADALRRLHGEFGATPVVTLGARGGLYWYEGRVRRYRSPRVPVRDTTGAGDAFHGAFAAGLAHGLLLPEIVARAARAGALACTALGGTGRLASRREWEGSRWIDRKRSPARSEAKPSEDRTGSPSEDRKG
jgi:sulfofructose kinase